MEKQYITYEDEGLVYVENRDVNWYIQTVAPPGTHLWIMRMDLQDKSKLKVSSEIIWLERQDHETELLKDKEDTLKHNSASYW